MTEPRSGTFSRKAVGWIVGLSVGSFLLAMVLVVVADDLGQPVSAGNDSFSLSAVGQRGIVEFLRRSGLPVLVRRTGRPGTLGPDSPLVIAEPEMELGAKDGEFPRLDSLLAQAAARKAPVLLVLPKWRATPDPAHPRKAAAVDARPLSEAAGILRALRNEPTSKVHLAEGMKDLEGSCETHGKAPVRVSIGEPRLLEPDQSLHPLVVCDGKMLVALMASARPGLELYVLSDPDVLNNQGLGRAQNAYLVAEIFRRELHARSIVWDETAHGFEHAEGFLGELLRFPMALLAVHAAVVLGWILWAGIGRFGKPAPARPPVESGKRTLIDSVAKIMSLAGRIELVIPRYVEQTIRTIAARNSLSAELPDREVVARLQSIAEARGVEFDLAAAQGEAWVLGAGRAREAVGLAMRMHRYREEMTHVR